MYVSCRRIAASVLHWSARQQRSSSEFVSGISSSLRCKIREAHTLSKQEGVPVCSSLAVEALQLTQEFDTAMMILKQL